MRKFFTSLIFVMIVNNLVAQEQVLLTKVDYSGGIQDITHKTVTLTDPQVSKFSNTTSDKLTIEVKVIQEGDVVTIKGEDENNITKTTTGSFVFDVTETISSGITNDETEYTFSFLYTSKDNPAVPVPAGKIIVKWKLFDANTTLTADGKKNRDKEIEKFKSNTSFFDPYDNKNDRVDLYFDENGRLLNFLPVNVDQNDLFYMHIVCEKGDEEKYRIKITEGEYAPSDLEIRPFTKITGSGTEKRKIVAKEYTTIILRAGPFTSNNFKFQISRETSGVEQNGLLYSLKINKLFHVGVGVSIVRSGLEAPEYKTYFNGTDTTIEAFDGKSRTLFTFNVIWYWTIFHQKREGSVIPNGRDVLKDEPSFSLTRLFPTLGVSMDNKFKENFFIGAVYEFARGGSITAGWHYGKVNVLKDKNFTLGKTKFSGTDADIKLDKEYKGAFYIGLNVDTRILNLLFSKGQ